MKLDLNKTLILLAAIATLGPDLTAAQAWFASLGVPWLSTVSHALGFLAALCAGLALALPKLRPILAALGLATAPEAIKAAPAAPPKDGGHTQPVSMLLLLVAALAAFTVLAVMPRKARADINLDDIAPKLTKCWGTTCLMPAGAATLTMFDLKNKKWLAGTVGVGAGLQLLFFADSPLASGLVAHVTGIVTQEAGKSSFVMPTLGVVALRYFEAGLSYRFSTTEASTPYLGMTANFPIDLFLGNTLPVRATQARAAQRGVQ